MKQYKRPYKRKRPISLMNIKEKLVNFTRVKY